MYKKTQGNKKVSKHNEVNMRADQRSDNLLKDKWGKRGAKMQ